MEKNTMSSPRHPLRKSQDQIRNRIRLLLPRSDELDLGEKEREDLIDNDHEDNS